MSMMMMMIRHVASLPNSVVRAVGVASVGDSAYAIEYITQCLRQSDFVVEIGIQHPRHLACTVCDLLCF